MELLGLIIFPILFLCSALMSSSETALFGLTRHQLYLCAASTHRFRRLVAELMRHPRQVLLTILIGNTTINVLIFASSYVISEQLHATSPLLASLWGVVTVILVIVIGEVLAKTLALSVAYAIVPWIAPLIRTLQIILSIPRIILDYMFVIPLDRLLIGGTRHSAPHVTVEQLKALVELSRQYGVIVPHENDMLQEIVALSAIKVRSIMVPRVDLSAFDLNEDRQVFSDMIYNRGLTKVPVYRTDVDHIIGLIHARDFYLSPDRPLEELVRPVRFVPEQMTADQLLKHFRKTATQLAIVVDEYGGVSGLVTLEDVVEQIVGEISEPGEDIRVVEQIAPDAFRMSGDLNIQSWFETFGISHPDYRVTTLGGLVTARLGRVPVEGDETQLGNVRMQVHKMKGRRVAWVDVFLLGESA